MDKLIKKIKSVLPLKTKILLSYLKNINHNPYSLNSFFANYGSVSDFFIFDQDSYSIGFIL